MVEPADAIASSDSTTSKKTAALAPTDRNAIDNAARSQADRQLIELLTGGSQQPFTKSDFGTARTLLRPPARARDEQWALGVGAIYAPIMPAVPQTGGVADAFLAPHWYKKHGEVGFREEQQRLNFVTAKLIPLGSARAVTGSDNGAPKVMPAPAAKSIRQVVRPPTHFAPTRGLRWPYGSDGVSVARARIGGDRDLLTLAPAFIR
jgi:hypothetical protein